MKKFYPVAVFLSVAAASLFMAGYAYMAASDAARIKFESTADEALNRIQTRVELHVSLLRATLALFSAEKGDVARETLNAFVSALDIDGHYAGIRGVGYAKLVKRGDEATAEGIIKRDYHIDKAVWPADSLEWRAPTVLIEPPDDRNREALGFDMFSEPARRAAMTEAMASGQPRASGRVLISQRNSDERVPGFVIYVPLTRGVAAGATPAERNAATEGFVYAPFRAADLFGTSLSQAPILPINLEVYDGVADSDYLLFRSQAAPDESLGAGFVAHRELTVAGRKWLIVFRPSGGFVYPSSRGTAIGLGLFGLVLAAALAMLMHSAARSFAAVNALHSASERSLLEKDLMLQEMKHRIKNSIARVLAISRQTAAGSRSLEEFSNSFGARLQAMAASQDMLTRSRWQKADLKELLKTELEQVFGQHMDQGKLSGPDVEIDESTTQALGLTFHELATNALKYGSADDETERLHVAWRVVDHGDKRRLLLTWTERGSGKVEPPAKLGFGTRLIEANIVRELGGTITRQYPGDGLIIDIGIPLGKA